MYPTKKLSEITKVINGRAYKADELLDSGKTRVLRVGNLFTNNHWYYSNLDLEDDKYCDDGDLIYAWSASFGPFIWNGGRCIYHYHIWKIACSENIDKRYLYWYLTYQTKNLSSKGNGVGMIHITKGMIEDLDVLFPPLPTQSCIVDRLDSAFANIDEQICFLQANIADVENVRKGVLGESFNFTVDNVQNLSEVVTFSQGIQVPIEEQKSETEEGYTRFLRIIDFTQGNQEIRYVKNLGDRYMVRKEDLSMVRYGASTGFICTGLEGILANNLFKISPINSLNKNYLFYFFKSPYFLSYLNGVLFGAAMPAINFGSLKNLQIPLPPLPRQHEVVAHLDRVFVETTLIRGEYEAQIRDLEILKQSFLEEVFAGRLVTE